MFGTLVICRRRLSLSLRYFPRIHCGEVAHFVCNAGVEAQDEADPQDPAAFAQPQDLDFLHRDRFFRNHSTPVSSFKQQDLKCGGTIVELKYCSLGVNGSLIWAPPPLPSP